MFYMAMLIATVNIQNILYEQTQDGQFISCVISLLPKDLIFTASGVKCMCGCPKKSPCTSS